MEYARMGRLVVTLSVGPVTLCPMSRPSESRFLTAQQVCDLFGVTKSTVNRWREQGLIKAHPLPSSTPRQTAWRYPEHQPVIANAIAALRRPS